MNEWVDEMISKALEGQERSRLFVGNSYFIREKCHVSIWASEEKNNRYLVSNLNRDAGGTGSADKTLQYF